MKRLLIVLAVMMVGGQSVVASDWTGANNMNWVNNLNWNPSTSSPTTTGSIANFTNTGAFGTVNVNAATVTVGTLSFSNSSGNYTIAPSAFGNAIVFDDGSGSGTLTKTGTGTATISAALAGTVSATVSGGTLALTNVDPAPAGNAFLSGTFTVNSGATLNAQYVTGISSSNSLGNANVVLNAGGTLVLTKAGGAAPIGLNASYYSTAPNNVDSSIFTSLATLDSAFSLSPLVTNALTNGGMTNFDYSNTGFGGGAPFAVDGFPNTDQIVARFEGKLKIAAGGTYTFSTVSDDGSVLFIDGVKVVDNNFYQGATERGGTVTLTAGEHDFQVAFYEGGGGAGLQVYWNGPDSGNTKVLMPNSVFSPTTDLVDLNTAISVKGNSTITMSGSKQVWVGVVDMDPGLTLTVNGGGLLRMDALKLNSSGTYTITAPAGNDVEVFQQLQGSTTSAVAAIVNWNNPGKLILDGSPPSFQPGSTLDFRITSGRLVVSSDPFDDNPIGNSGSNVYASVTLNGNGAALELVKIVDPVLGSNVFSLPFNQVNIKANATIVANVSGNTGTIALGSTLPANPGLGTPAGTGVAIDNGMTLTTTVGANATLDVQGVISGGNRTLAANQVAIVKNGSGILRLSAPNTFVGANTIVANANVGLDAKYYQFSANPNTANFTSLSALSTAFDPITPNVNVKNAGRNGLDYSNSGFGGGSPFAADGFGGFDNIVARMTGKITVTNAGFYKFWTKSDDGSVLFIDGTMVVDNNFYQGATERSGSSADPTGTINLSAGQHDIVLAFYEGGGGAGVTASYQAVTSLAGTTANAGGDQGGAKVIIPGNVLSNSVPGGAITVTEGVLLVAQTALGTSALGDAGNTVVVRAGGAVAFDGNVTASNVITIFGAGATGRGAVDNLANDNSFTGTISLGDKATVGQTSGSLTLKGVVQNGIAQANTLTFNPLTDPPSTSTKGGIYINGANVIRDGTGMGALTVQMNGIGTLTLQSNNSYTGGTVINSGTVVADGSLGATNVFGSGSVTVGTSSSPATLSVKAPTTSGGTNNSLGSNAIIVNDKGTFALNPAGTSSTIINYSGTSITSTGRITVGGNTTANLSSAVVNLTSSTFTPGLVEGFINNTGSVDTTTPNPGNSTFGVSGGNHTLTFRLGETNVKDASHWGDNQTWVYTGQIHIAPGSTFRLAENIDDQVRVYIDGVQVLADNTWNNPTHSSPVSTSGPNGDGWHDIEVRFMNGGGGAGAVTGSGWVGAPDTSGGFGFGLNTSNIFTVDNNSQANGGDYFNPIDPGDGSLLRSPSGGLGLVTLGLSSTTNVFALTGTGVISFQNSSTLNIGTGNGGVSAARTIGLGPLGSNGSATLNIAGGTTFTISTLDLDGTKAGQSSQALNINTSGATGTLIVRSADFSTGQNTGGSNIITNSDKLIINHGSVYLNGSGGNTNTGFVQVLSGSTLGGSNTGWVGTPLAGHVNIGGNVVVGSNSFITAGQGTTSGSAVGRLTINNGLGVTTLGGSSGNFGTYVWKLGSNTDGGSSGSVGAGTAFDQIAVSGGSSSTINITGGTLQLAFGFDPNTITGAKTWRIIDYSGSAVAPTTGNFTNTSGGNKITFAGGSFSTYVGTGTLSAGGLNDLGAVYLFFDGVAPVPEASHVLLACLAGLGLFRWVRRRQVAVQA